MQKRLDDPILKAYYNYNSLVKQQIDSYNMFIKYGMQRVIDSIGVIKTNVEGFEIKLGKVVVEPPRFYEVRGAYRNILPSEALIRNLTYASPVFLEMIPVYNGTEKPLYSPVFIGEIPVMVKSDLCHTSRMTKEELVEAGMDPLDPGGYFIINGSERVLVGLEDLVPNKVLVTAEEGEVTAKVFSKRGNFRAGCTVTRLKDGTWIVDFPSIPPRLHLLSLLRVLFRSEKLDELEQYFLEESDKREVENDFLYNLELLLSQNEENGEELLARKISPGQPKEYQLNRMYYLIDNYLLPHLGVEEKDRIKKGYYLIKMAIKTTLVHNKKLLPDDRDHYGNKRIKLAGALMEELFAYAFNYLVKDIIYQASKADVRGRKLQVHTLIRQDAFTDRILYSMATGNWIGGQTGVSQLLDRTSFISSLSHRRRIISPLSKSHPHFKARDLHGTQYGKICPSETPEGPSTSLVKNMALFAEVTTGVEEEHVENIIKRLGVREK